MGEKLKHPPLIEAICEFRFAEQEAWDWTVPGRLYERVKDEFPERTQVQGISIQFEQDNNRPGATIGAAIPDRVQLKRTDGSALVQVGPHLLTVNHLRPYPSWESFLDLITVVLHSYRELAPATPLSRIGLRYINQISLTEGRPNIAQYLTVAPNLTGSLQRPLRGFYQRYELEQEQPRGVLIHQTGTQIVNDGQLVLALDLDFMSQDVVHLQEVSAVTVWLGVAHELVYDTFANSINVGLLQELRQGES